MYPKCQFPFFESGTAGAHGQPAAEPLAAQGCPAAPWQGMRMELPLGSQGKQDRDARLREKQGQTWSPLWRAWRKDQLSPGGAEPEVNVPWWPLPHAAAAAPRGASLANLPAAPVPVCAFYVLVLTGANLCENAISLPKHASEGCPYLHQLSCFSPLPDPTRSFSPQLFCSGFPLRCGWQQRYAKSWRKLLKSWEMAHTLCTITDYARAFPARRKSGPSYITPGFLISEDASHWWLVCVLQLISLHLSLRVSPKNSMVLEEIRVIWSRTFDCRLSTRISSHPTFYSSSSYLPCWSNLLLF